MLQNNVEMDLKMRLIESGQTQTEVAEKLGVSLSYVNRITKGREQIVNKTFVKMMDELGYDVELTYRKKQLTEAATNRDLSMAEQLSGFRTSGDMIRRYQELH